MKTKPNVQNRLVDQVKADVQHHWFPRKCCINHAKRHKRTPGLFQLEFEEDEFLGL